MSTQGQINERLGRLILAQHEVIVGLAELLVATTEAVMVNDPSMEHLLKLVDKTSITIEAATLLLQEVPNA